MYVAKWSYSTSTWLSFHKVMVKSDHLIYLTNSISYRSFTLQNSTTGMTDVTKKVHNFLTKWIDIYYDQNKNFSYFREITRLATMLAGLIAPRIRLGLFSASISCEHCRSSRNNPRCAPRHLIYYTFLFSRMILSFALYSSLREFIFTLQ